MRSSIFDFLNRLGIVAVTIPKANILNVASVTTTSSATPFDCTGTQGCYLQGSFSLSLDLTSTNVVGGSENTNGYWDNDLSLDGK